MYKCIDKSDSTILITSYKDNQLVGFVSGSLGKTSLYKPMLAFPFTLMYSLLPSIFNPYKLAKIFSILNHISGAERNKYPKAELLTICVNSSYRRQRIADELYAELINYFKLKSTYEFVIVVGELLEANHFYKRMGAEVTGKLEVHTGAQSNVYTQSCS